MGRDKLSYGKRKTPIRVFVENETIDSLGVTKIRQVSKDAIDRQKEILDQQHSNNK